MEWNVGVAALLLFLLVMLIMLLIPVMLITLMLSFHIYMVFKKDLNQKKGEDQIEISSQKKEEEKKNNLILEKEEHTENIEKKKRGGPAYVPNINIVIYLHGDEDDGKVITTVEETEKEENKGSLKSTVYSYNLIRNNKDSKKDSGKKEEDKTTIVTKQNDMEQLPDSSQSQGSDEQSTKNMSKKMNSDGSKNNVIRKSNSMQSHTLSKQDKQYVNEKNYFDESNLDEINREIAERGYGKWVKQEWKRIGTGSGKKEIGDDEDILQYGKGNIKIIEGNNRIHHIGVPAKEKMTGYELNTGAFKVCYEVVNPVDENMDYRIVRIDKLASLQITENKINIYSRGKVQVEQI